jgi:hypothetical protein
MARLRVSPPRIFPEATRAGRPPSGSAGSGDAYRQTGFVLGKEVDLVLRGLQLEGAVAAASSGAKYRTQTAAAALGPWSRGWLTRLEALHAAEWGNYVAAMPLLRAAADSEAACLAMLRDQAAEWNEWLDQGGVCLAPSVHATEYRLHAFRSAETLAGHAILGPVYRAATDLSLPHFGATLLLAGNDSSPDRVLMTFGDRDFHLGLAELVLGWLLMLGVAQCETLAEFPAVFATGERAEIEQWVAESTDVTARGDRCTIEAVDMDGEKRYLVHNWRRAAGAAQKRILL